MAEHRGRAGERTFVSANLQTFSSKRRTFLCTFFRKSANFVRKSVAFSFKSANFLCKSAKRDTGSAKFLCKSAKRDTGSAKKNRKIAHFSGNKFGETPVPQVGGNFGKHCSPTRTAPTRPVATAEAAPHQRVGAVEPSPNDARLRKGWRPALGSMSGFEPNSTP